MKNNILTLVLRLILTLVVYIIPFMLVGSLMEYFNTYDLLVEHFWYKRASCIVGQLENNIYHFEGLVLYLSTLIPTAFALPLIAKKTQHLMKPKNKISYRFSQYTWYAGILLLALDLLSHLIPVINELIGYICIF